MTVATPRLVAARLAVLALTLAAPAPALAAEAAIAPTAQAHTEALHALFSDQQQDALRLSPITAWFRGDYRFLDRLDDTLSDDAIAERRALNASYAQRLGAIDRARLGAADRLSYDLFDYQVEQALAASRRDFDLVQARMPINQMVSLANFFAQINAGTSIAPFETVAQYQAGLARIDGFVRYADLAIARMREGLADGVVQPRIVMERVLPQLAAHLVDRAADSVFYRPIRNFPHGMAQADRERLQSAYVQAIETRVIPAYRRLHDFVRDSYLPATRAEHGLWAMAGGRALYAFLVRQHTTTTLSPDDIHRIGLDEVRRITAEMARVKQEAGFDGTLQEFFLFLRTDARFYYQTRDELLDGYRAIRARIEPHIDRLFNRTPKADFVIEPIPDYLERSAAGAQYRPGTPDGVRPGVFMVNTYDVGARPKYDMEATFIHEAAPGHHFQISLAQEQADLPDFRRFYLNTAYVEGWALYAETLGRELGVYDDPYTRFGALVSEIFRANRLVVDTGIHHKGWTREKAIDFMLSNSPMSETDIMAEVERYIAIPGQALAYKIGQLKFIELRERARAELGATFDIRAFHDQVLLDGALPLSILEAKIDRWIERERTGAQRNGEVDGGRG